MPDRTETAEFHVGFTGSRRPMTRPQAETVGRILTGDWFHHGDCVGSDAEAQSLARLAGMRIALHPPANRSMRAFCVADVSHEPKDYIARNHDIVDATTRLVAAPSSHEEEVRSGTWATIRYARRQGKPITIVFPDGSVRNE
jgi:hypothetical protein